MLLNLLLTGLLVVITFAIHFLGLVTLSAVLRHLGQHPANRITLIGQGLSLLLIVMALFGLHSIEIWVYTFVYLWIGALDTLDAALYYSISTFTTVGYGDVLLSREWRILGAAQSMNGFLLIGWSTAFLVGVTARVRAFEADIERPKN